MLPNFCNRNIDNFYKNRAKGNHILGVMVSFATPNIYIGFLNPSSISGAKISINQNGQFSWINL